MAETVKLPGVGPVKKNYLYVAGAAAAGFVAYAWWTRGGGLGDPGGEEPGVPVDEFGDERITPNTVDTFDVAVDTRTGLLTNAEWSQFAISHLAGLGYDSTVVSTAIGRFLARQPLNKVDLDLTRQAWAVAGEPPEGRPWTIIPESSPAAVAVGAVSGLRAAKVSAGSVTLNWDPVQGATGYEVKRDGGGVARRTATSHTSSGLTGGRAYTFRVRAHNSANQYGPEATVTVTTTPKGSTPGTGTIGFPQNLKVRSTTRTAVTIEWGPVPGAKSYVVTRQGGGRGVNRPGRSHTSGGLEPNSMYTFIVRAVDTQGRSGPSNVVTARTKP